MSKCIRNSMSVRANWPNNGRRNLVDWMHMVIFDLCFCLLISLFGSHLMTCSFVLFSCGFPTCIIFV
uniref:CRAL-TRIO domain-containing protein YKL091C n=1 Tax=Rhizophora mucronata TaxID=61149 RepID=A0A2P2JZ42_RHIMU